MWQENRRRPVRLQDRARDASRPAPINIIVRSGSRPGSPAGTAGSGIRQHHRGITAFILLPVSSLVKYMTKTCAQCGHAGIDDHALFCNRCGAPVPEEKKPAFPVCPGCGTVVSDELAQFCNRCGTRILPVPVVCSTCGSPAIDSHSRFCTRCGTTFEPKPVARSLTCPSCGAPDPSGQSLFCNRCGSSFSRPAAQVLHQPGPAPVVITQRKPAAPAPLVIVPESDWEPWNDVPPAHTISGTAAPPAQPEPHVHHEQQITMPQKRYSHLPLVADEMRKKPAPADDHHPQEIAGLPARKKSSSSGKKGVLGFLNKK